MLKHKTAPRKKPQKLGTPYDVLVKRLESAVYFPARLAVTIGRYRISSGTKIGKVWIGALDKNDNLLDSGEFSEKKLAAVIGQFYAENF